MNYFTFPTPESPIARNFKSSELSIERDVFSKVVIEYYSTNVDVMYACVFIGFMYKKKERKENDNIDEGEEEKKRFSFFFFYSFVLSSTCFFFFSLDDRHW